MANATVVVGTQWGDEGKAKIVDVLAEDVDLVVRYSGGANAGHTIVFQGKKFVLHLIPAGILYPDKVCVLGNGVVVDPYAFLREIDHLSERNCNPHSRVFVSDQAHVVMPYHFIIEKMEEFRRADKSVGTTMRGIGPAYVDKAARRGVRMGEFIEKDFFVEKFQNNIQWICDLWFPNKPIPDEFKSSIDSFMADYDRLVEQIHPYVIDTPSFLHQQILQDKSLLFEGAQGTFLDVDHGTYPYVTSSNSIAGGACVGAGVGPKYIDHVMGVVKAYTTRVGKGPFPTEFSPEEAEHIRRVGDEFGATTGRPRRCGWLDGVMLKRACVVNGVTELAITKLDVLDSLDEIKFCVGYEYNGDVFHTYPSNLWIVAKVKPIYETFPGWQGTTQQAHSFEQFPTEAKQYLKFISDFVDVPIKIVSVGADRDQTIKI